MRTLLIGDCHFGIKTNSLSWLNLQLKFFRKQVYNILDNDNEINKIVFLGDLFDVRYAINQYIGIEVKRLISEISSRYKNKNFIFIAGNHDYYSPLEEFVDYNAYELVFGSEYEKIHDNVKFITKDPYLDNDNDLYLPWYFTEVPEHFDELLYNYRFGTDVKCVYCHTDLTTWPGSRTSSLRSVPVYAGHIHYIVEDDISNLHNIGSCLALTFNDVNQQRYVYIMDNDTKKIIDKIENVTTPKFYRIFNDDIFKTDDSLFNNSYVQIFISNKNLKSAKFIERIKEIKEKYINSNVTIHPIDDEVNINTLSAEGFNTNISKYIDDNMPKHLENKYQYIKNKLIED